MATILVVDDELGIRDLLFEILNDEGHQVELAMNAAEARSIRASLQPDLVLLDIWMPDTDGITLLKEWARDNLLTMPVVMMSGHATIDTAVEATRIGALNFLEKPIALQKLLKTVSKALERAPLKKLDEPEPQTQPKSIDLPKTTNQDEYISGIAKSYYTLPLRESRDLFEKAYFEYQMVVTGGSMTRISEFTGLERTHLYRKLKALGIDVTKKQE